VKNLILLFSIISTLLLNSCTSQKTQAFENTFKNTPKNIIFPKIKKHRAILECVSSKIEFKAGTTPALTFRLKNLSSKRLIILEWMMKESHNIKIYYTPWVIGMKKPTKDQWKVIAPEIGDSPKRMTLDLATRNSVLLKTNLDFVKDIKIKSPQDFLIYAELNLSSIRIRSKMMQIRINP